MFDHSEHRKRLELLPLPEGSRFYSKDRVRISRVGCPPSSASKPLGVVCLLERRGAVGGIRVEADGGGHDGGRVRGGEQR